MAVRITQSQFFSVLYANLHTNYAKLASLQNQVSSGKRINQPSDDPLGASVGLSVRNSQADVARYSAAAADAHSRLEQAASLATDANTALSRVRELVVQGLNDTLGPTERRTIATEIEELGKQLLQLANTKTDGRYVFGGTKTSTPPFAETDAQRVVWQGGEGTPRATIGAGDEIELGIPGSQLFASWAPTGTRYAGLTGARAGTSNDQGSGFEQLNVRHDGTTLSLGAGIVLFNGGTFDTLVGTRTLEVDGTNNRVRLGNGPWTPIPSAASGMRPDVAVKDQFGAEVQLDFSGWSGADVSGTATGSASVSIDGTNFTAIALNETDLQLTDATMGAIVHVNTLGIVRAGTDLVTFGGTSNVFDVIQGLAADLRNDAGLNVDELRERLGSRLTELDLKHDDVLVGAGVLAAKSSRAADVQERLGNRSIDLAGRLEAVEDVDLTSAVLEITKTQQTLELVQSTGAKLLRTSLLDYLR